MKNKIYACITIITMAFGFTDVSSQNLIKNPNLDAKCIASTYAEVVKTDDWTNANGGTVDLFDKTKSKNCNHPNAIPTNYMGYQKAYNENQNYAGLTAFYDDGSNNNTDRTIDAQLNRKEGYKEYSEYLQGELSEPLIAGKIYQLSFRVNLANNSDRAVSCLGALLTVNKLEHKSNEFLKEIPQFISHRVIKDTLNWVTIYGAFIAEGGEKFITIGCFKDDYFQVENLSNPNENDSRKAYYYISGASLNLYVAKPELEAIVYGVDFVEVMNLQFTIESSDIDPQFYSELDEVANWMKQNPTMSFYIAGYTDKTGNNTINDPLSIRRAKEVKKYLTQKGVKESNLVTEGFGSDHPIENKVKSRKNRRVEIYLYGM